MALHDSEQASLIEIAAEVHRLRSLTEELHEAVVKSPKTTQGTIITLRTPQVENAPQKLRVRSKG